MAEVLVLVDHVDGQIRKTTAELLTIARRQIARGNLELQGDVLRVAPGRWLWHDAIAADLLA